MADEKTLTPRQAMKQAIKLLGNKTVVARLTGVSNQAVSQWKQIPLKHCVAIETALGGRMTCRQLRPDFPWPRSA